MITSVYPSIKFPLENRILASIRRNRLVQPADRVGVAVSGGGDSVGLLLLLDALREKLGISLAVLHFNHQLRGGDSDADEAFVSDLAEKLGLVLFRGRGDVAATARREHWNVEDASRRMRYAFFEQVVKENGATRIATGHMLDDQAETVLARLCRGTGFRGLSAIHAVRGCVMRPLLETRRAEIRDYLGKRGMVWREDASNQDCGRLRARIRQGLLPTIEREYSPSIAIHLAELARQSQSEEALWATLVEDGFQRCVRNSQGKWNLDARDILNGLAGVGSIEWPAAAQQGFGRRMVRRVAEEVCGAGNFPAARHVEQVMELAATGTSGEHLDLPHGLQVTREFDRLVFSLLAQVGTLTGASAHSRAYQYSVRVPTAGSVNVSVPEIGESYCLKVFDWPGVARETREGLNALDPACLHSTLILRNWHPGDAYWPTGGGRSRKVGRMLMARRIPERIRKGWPVLTSGGEVVWVRGLPPARNVAAGPGTKTGLTVKELRELG
jgi:tRNA(Ile)-lysidine synthase